MDELQKLLAGLTQTVEALAWIDQDPGNRVPERSIQELMVKYARKDARRIVELLEGIA